jgi:hypothetical protein
MVKKNPLLNPHENVEVKKYVCSLKLQKAIEQIYPKYDDFKYPHGAPGTVNKGKFVSFNGRLGAHIHGYCDFADKSNVPLSMTNRDDLLKLGLIKEK